MLNYADRASQPHCWCAVRGRGVSWSLSPQPSPSEPRGRWRGHATGATERSRLRDPGNSGKRQLLLFSTPSFAH